MLHSLKITIGDRPADLWPKGGLDLLLEIAEVDWYALLYGKYDRVRWRVEVLGTLSQFRIFSFRKLLNFLYLYRPVPWGRSFGLLKFRC